MTERAETRRRILVTTSDPLTARMPGPAIRAWHLAEALAAEHDVVLVSTVACDRSHGSFRTALVDGEQLRLWSSWMDILVVQGGLLRTYPFLAQSDKIIVADIYDPFHLENLASTWAAASGEGDAVIAHLTSVLNEQLQLADFFLCASDRQRDFWLGGLAALGRVNRQTYGDDQRLRGLIDVVAFGLPSTPAIQRRHGLRGTVPGIAPDDKVIIWAGGVYDWFDPGSLVVAVDRLRTEIPSIRLYFLGMQHPNPNIPPMRVARELRQLSADRGLTGRHVFFNDEWVDYDRRADYLLDADIGVSTHLDHVETSFSFRTRVLDYLWAGLPMVLTDGDVFAQLVRSEHLGAVVAPGDADSIAVALRDVLAAPPDRAAILRTAQSFSWDQVVVPLLEFCRAPSRAPDQVARALWAQGLGREALFNISPVRGEQRLRRAPVRAVLRSARPLARRTLSSLRNDGLTVTARRVARSVGRRTRRPGSGGCRMWQRNQNRRRG